MQYPIPRQPEGAISIHDCNEVTVSDIEPAVFLTNMEEPKMPYSTNGFMLADLISHNGRLPVPGFDIVIFYSDDIVVCIGTVTALLTHETTPAQPGRWRSLVSCQPWLSIANVPTSEEAEDILWPELRWVSDQIRITRIRPPSRGEIPRGALMKDQQEGHELVREIRAESALLDAWAAVKPQQSSDGGSSKPTN